MNDGEITVDVTDDLDAFSAELFGTAKPAEKVEEKEEVTETPSATEEAEEAEVEESKEPEKADGDDAPADDADEDEEIEEEKPQPKSRKSARERIHELTRQAREAERERDALRKELENSKVKVDTTKEDASASRSEDSRATEGPNPDELVNGELKYPLGEFDPLYIRDLTRHAFQQESERQRIKDEQTREQQKVAQAEQEMLTSWTEKLDEASERLPDFREKIIELEDTFAALEPDYGKYLASTIMSLEFGPEVLDYLATNLDEAQKIVDSGPTRATIALGRIEARFAAGQEVEKGKVVTTQAPPPPPRTKGSGGKPSVAADTDDLDAFEKQFFVAPNRR